MPSERMTLVIASYERRELLLRLLRGLDDQVARSDELRADLSVVVVLDGSTDGSQEAVESETWTVPVRVVWQPNRGLAAARNTGLAAAEGGVVWFLDDDLIPAPGLVEQHRRAHREGPPRVVVGRCRIPHDAGAPEPFVRWWDAFYQDMADGDAITRFDRFTAANTSAPSSMITAVGGFDETFGGYGLEDYELAVRLLDAGTPICFARLAVVWHPEVPSRAVMVSREHSVGANAARIATMHPHTADVLFPAEAVSAPRQLIRRARIRRPRSLMLVSRISWAVSHLTRRVHATTSRRAEHLARAAAHAAGVAASDPDGTLLRRVLGAA